MTQDNQPSNIEVMAKLDRLHDDVREIKGDVKALNGSVRRHDTDIAVLQDWRESQVQPAVGQVQNLRVELAKYAALGTGIGGVVGIVLTIAKVAGVF